MALVGVVIYLPALANGFTDWDDPGYVVRNPHLGPFDARFFAWAFTVFRQGNWHPLTWLSLGIDRALFGNAPWGYHLTNVLLHGTCTLFVVLVVEALFARGLGARDDRSLVAAAVAGLVFALHPLHVESVAWVSERKGLLCGVFYVAALLCYLRFAEHRRRSWYLACLGSFFLALLAKPMAVTFPLVLLILDVYPLGRLTRSGFARVLVEKAPFFVLSIGASVVTLIAQWTGGAVAAMQRVGLWARLWNAERALGFYLVKLALPIDLTPVYPLEPGASPWRWDFLVALAFVLSTTMAAVLWRRRAPLLAATWAAYVVMLLPVVGLIQVGEQAAADRYMYLPLLAPAIGIAAVVVRLWSRGQAARIALVASTLVAAAGMSALTVRQIGVWRDPRTLWTWVVAKQPGAAIAHYNLGEHLRAQGDLEGAALCWRRAVEVEPAFSWPLSGLGSLAALRGEPGEARRYFERALAVNPSDAAALYNLATSLEDEGRFAEARTHYERFLEVAPAKFAHVIPEVRAKLVAPAPASRPEHGAGESVPSE